MCYKWYKMDTTVRNLTSSEKRGSLRALKPESFPEGNEKLSSEVDSIVYGLGR